MALPAKHCAFKGCGWTGEDEAELHHHLRTSHRPALCHVAALLPKMHSEAEQFIAAYEDAIAVVVRRGAPLAAYSIDRRCLYNYAEFIQSGGPESLVCFLCARRFPYMPGWHQNGISWVAPFAAEKHGAGARRAAGGTCEERFCGLTRRKAEEFFGMGTYLRRYGRCEGCKTDLTQPEPLQALEDWKLRVEFTEQPLDIVCCPEDRECSDEQCASGSTPRCCRKCRLPL